MERFKRLGIAALTVSALTATALAGIAPRTRPAPAAPAVAHLVAFGGRGPSTNPATGKLDSMLADIVRHSGRVRAGSKLADLRALNPAARFQVTASAGPMVLIDAVTRGDPQRLKAALLSLGLQNASLFSNDVSGWMPVSQLTAAAARTEVHAMRAALPRARTGSVTSTGDYVQGSEALRGLWPDFDGRGITVGVLSDSFDCYAIYAPARQRRASVRPQRLRLQRLHGRRRQGRLDRRSAEWGHRARRGRPGDQRHLHGLQCRAVSLTVPALQRRGSRDAAGGARRRAGRGSRVPYRGRGRRRISPTASWRSPPPAPR